MSADKELPIELLEGLAGSLEGCRLGIRCDPSPEERRSDDPRSQGELPAVKSGASVIQPWNLFKRGYAAVERA